MIKKIEILQYSESSHLGGPPTPPAPGGMGGPPRFCYYYDSLDRLVAATGDYNASDGRYGRYDLSMSYDDLWRVTSKSLDLWRHTAPHSPRQYAGYSLSYGYGTDDGTRFRLSTIAETHYRAENDTVGARRQTFHRYQYDGSGNLTYEESGHPVAGGAVNWKSDERKLLWDAENRLRALDENGYVSTYVYDADGERVVKQHGGNRGLYVNSAGRDSLTETTAFTLYVNPYVTWTEGGKYVKHVYMGGSRVASRLGVAHLMGNNPIAVLGGVLPGHVLKDSMQKAAVVTSYGVFGVPYGGEDRTAVLPYSNEPGNFLGDFTDPNGLEGRQYFYHPDHLGSSTVITDGDGNVVQHIEYMPYGEVFMEETGDTWNTPYKFNGKEYDEETGLYYYGARYYEPRLSLWISVDPSTEKYPTVSGYVYCANNPVKLVDPDGNVVIPVHGTWSNPSTWKNLKGIGQATSNLFNDQRMGKSFKWSGQNFRSSRTSAALELVSEIRKQRGKGEPVTLVGHSHGGNVIIEAVNMMVKMKEFDGVQINILTINTPVRDDYQLSNDALKRVQHVNVYDPKDPIQVSGGNSNEPQKHTWYHKPTLADYVIGEMGPAGRTFNNAQNIEVDNPQSAIIWNGLKTHMGDFHNSHNRVNDWINKTRKEENR